MKKEYFKPTIMVTMLNMQPLMQNNSVTSVKGLDGLNEEIGGEFQGEKADSRRRRSVWDEDEEEDF